MAEALVLLEFLPLAVEGCMKAYHAWKDAEKIGEDGRLFYARLCMQTARIENWKTSWDIPNWTEDKLNDDKTYRVFRDNPELALNYLSLIQAVLDDLSELKDKFPSLKHATIKSQPAAVARLAEIGQKKYKGSANVIRSQSTIMERLKWAQSSTRRNKVLHDLNLLINDLVGFFEPPQKGLLTTHETPVSRDAQNIVLDKDVVDEDHLLSSLATLKTMVSRVALMPAVKKLPNRKIKNDSGRDLENNRSVCQVDGNNYLVEWKIVRHDSGKIVLSDRIDGIARLLQARDKPDELRTMNCAWVVEDQRQNETQYKLGYVLAAGRCFTLRDLLNEQGTRLETPIKYQMAFVLAQAVLYLHFAKWFHKAIRSDNVLFLANNLSDIDAAWPYLVGFDASRPNNATEMTENPRYSHRFNLYRHPAYQGVPIDTENSEDHDENVPEASASNQQRFRQEYDIYSLGVVLLEIGLGATVERLFKETSPSGPFVATDFKRWMMEKKLSEVSACTTQEYADIVKACIEANSDTSGCSIETSFYTTVVRPLEKLQPATC